MCVDCRARDVNASVSESYESINERITDALEQVESVDKPDLSKLARDFTVPYQRLRFQ